MESSVITKFTFLINKLPIAFVKYLAAYGKVGELILRKAMGRASKLTEIQWIEVERRHLVGGVSVNALALEFGVNESSIRRRLRPNKAESPNPQNNLRLIAEKKVKADAESRRITEQIASLSQGKQHIVYDLAQKLRNISEDMGSAAENSAASARFLTMLAKQQLELVDEVNPMLSIIPLQASALLTKMANGAAEIPDNLLRANKDHMEAANERERAAADKQDAAPALRPQLTREEWMAAHGMGTPAGPAE